MEQVARKGAAELQAVPILQLLVRFLSLVVGTSSTFYLLTPLMAVEMTKQRNTMESFTPLAVIYLIVWAC